MDFYVIWSVLLILFKFNLSVDVFLLLILILNWGMLFKLLGWMLVSFGFCVVMFNSWLCVFISVLWLFLLWLISCILKFVVLFSFMIGGGIMGKVEVFWIWLNVLKVWFIIVNVELFLFFIF